jgi:hypothetical protein
MCTSRDRKKPEVQRPKHPVSTDAPRERVTNARETAEKASKFEIGARVIVFGKEGQVVGRGIYGVRIRFTGRKKPMWLNPDKLIRIPDPKAQ